MQKITKHFKTTISIALLLLAISAINTAAATFTVTNTNDSGAGSLRQAILDANASSDADTIVFDASLTDHHFGGKDCFLCRLMCHILPTKVVRQTLHYKENYNEKLQK